MFVFFTENSEYFSNQLNLNQQFNILKINEISFNCISSWLLFGEKNMFVKKKKDFQSVLLPLSSLKSFSFLTTHKYCGFGTCKK